MKQNAILQPRIYSAAKSKLQELIPLDTPLSMHIDISSVCNYKCSFCFQADSIGMKKVGLKRGFMEFNLFKKIIDESKGFPNSIKKIKIGNHGEPTLNPNIIEMIEYASKSGVAEIIEMFTNGSKLTPNLNQNLIDAGLQRINISLEGLDDKRYLEVAGVKQNFQEIIDGVSDLYDKKIKSKSNLKIYVKIADQAHALKKESKKIFILTDEEKEYFMNTFSPICDEIFIEKVVPQWSETQLDKQNDVNETGMYGQKISNWKEACPFIFMYMHINCDGTVSPCTLDWPRKVVIGNVNDTDVKLIWKGQLLKDLQIAMLAGQRKCINFCSGCSAPMVCVEENLDADNIEMIHLLNGQTEYQNLKNNPWLTNNDVQVVNFLR
jgi:radical SAM protein with 4Fe4S-binding SPASM domain